MNQPSRAAALLRTSELRIDRQLALRVLRHCLKTKLALGEVIEEALRIYLATVERTQVAAADFEAGEGEAGTGLLH